MANHVHSSRGRSSGLYILLLGIAALAAFLFLNGHGYHLLAYAPLLILLACPLLHFGMHGGHGGHGGHGRDDGKTEDSSQAAEQADPPRPLA